MITDPNVRAKVVHSRTKSAWNVIGTQLGGKYKIARIPYVAANDESITAKNRAEALHHAEYISFCFNDSIRILRK